MDIAVHEVSLSEAIPREWDREPFSYRILRSCSLRILMMLR